jgi:hypothetical protein
MRVIPRLLAIGFVATAGLALAGAALAKPRLIISGSTIQVTEDKSDAAPSHISIYIPSGYSAALAQTAGAQIGIVHADLQALAISPDAIIQADGAVIASDPSTPALQASGLQCTGSATHAAIWLLHVTVSGQTIDVPVYVDPTSGTETALGIAKLQLCLSSPYEAAGAARAPFGVKIVNAKITLDAGVITTPATGAFLWRAAITPWTVEGATPNLPGTVEAQSIVALPPAAKLKAVVKKVKKTKKNTVTLTGSVTQGGTPVAGATVTLLAGGKKAATVKTNARGLFSKKLVLKKTTKFRARVLAPQRDSACQSPLPTALVPGGCMGATSAAFTVASPTVVARKK